MSLRSASPGVAALALFPAIARPLVGDFCIGMSGRIASRFLVLIVGAVLVGGRRTVTRVLSAASAIAEGHFSSFHRLFSRARWSMVPMAKALAVHAVRRLPADAPIEVAIDDTLTRHRGPQVYGRGLHRDAARSTQHGNLRCYGHRWVVLTILTPMPLVSRLRALPVLCGLHLTRDEAERQGRRPRSPCETARLLALRLFRWFPGRSIVFLGDGACGCAQREVILFTGVGLWYRSDSGAVRVRWVLLRDPEGRRDDVWLYSTDTEMRAERIAALYARRWSIETTFQECNEHLGLQSPRCRSRHSVLRMTPCLLGLYSLVSLLYAAHVQRTGMGIGRAIPSARPWYDKREPTFVDALTLVRRQMRERILVRALGEAVVQKFPPRIREMLIMPMGQAA